MRKLIVSALFLPIAIICISILNTHKAQAVSLDYQSIDVQIDINKDTTYTVKETRELTANGDFHGLRRDIPLDNPNCAGAINQTCGGFDLIIPIGIYDETGKEPKTGKVGYYEVTPEGSSVRYFRFEWELYANGKSVTNEKHTWTVEYMIIGGINWVEDSAYFYWNTIEGSRPSYTDNVKVKINFPKNIELSKNDFQIYSPYSYSIKKSYGDTSVTLTTADLPSSGDITASYKFEDGDLIEPVSFTYKFIKPKFASSVYWNGLKIGDSTRETFDLFPAGKHEFQFKHFGYKTVKKELTFKSGEAYTEEVTLEPEAWMSALLALNSLFTVIGFAAVPLAIYLGYKRYKKSGSDKNAIKTIIPLFDPPKDVSPYLAGSLKDEIVDKRDVTGTIIDLAYRGYIKIKELEKGKNYQLNKLEGKKGDPGLNSVEQSVMNAFFGSSDEMTTSALTYTFVTKYRNIEKDIYSEMVAKGYFKKSPKTTRETNLGIGIVAFILSIILTVGSSLVLTIILGQFTIFSLGLACMAGAITLIASAKYMPQKTEIGSKVYNQVLGFKMFMETADRYRMQNLQPEDFLKYLGFAVVFGIEDKWAKSFKDIYKEQPDWYDGTGNVTDALFISSFSRSFSNATSSKITSLSGSAGKGSGWSGGGSFGGFSGGGGGGGSSGGW